MSNDNPVFMIAQLSVTDMPGFFADYAGPLKPINERHGAELVVGAPAEAVQVVEGDYGKNLTVVIRFPNAEAQKAWYSDPDYQPLLKRRFELTDTALSTLIVAPAA